MAIRELAAPLTAREWLQEFWGRTGRLPYKWEIPPAFYPFFPGRRVPVGWAAELEMMAALRQLGLEPDWCPGADAAGVDVRFILDGVHVRMQLKVRREEKAVQLRVARCSPRKADAFVVLPVLAMGRLSSVVPRLIQAIRAKLAWA